MSAIKGFQIGRAFSSLSKRIEAFLTVQQTHLGRGVADTVQHGVALLETITSTDIDQKNGSITLPATIAKAGYVVQNKTTGYEFNVIGVDGDVVSIDVNDKVALGTVGDDFAVKRFVMSQLNADGAMDVVAQSGPIQFKLDALDTEVSEDTATPANSIPLPTKVLDDAGLNISDILTAIRDNVSQEQILASIWVDAANTTITAAGITVGAIASAGKTIQVSNNANDILVEVNGVLVATVIAGSPVSYAVGMGVGNVVLKSTGADITGGTVSVNIMG